MKTILFVSQQQFGYLVDYYKHAKSLSKQDRVIYVSKYDGDEILSVDGVEVYFSPKVKNRLLNKLLFFKTVVQVLFQQKPDVCYICYSPFISVVRFFKRHVVYVLDVRTADVSESKLKRVVKNNLLLFESFFFKHLTVISRQVEKRLKLDWFGKKNQIVPLGADAQPLRLQTNTSKVTLVYTGTFIGRRIEDTILGFGMFLKAKEKDLELDIVYDLIGAGDDNSILRIRTAIEELNLTKYVHLLGYIPNDQVYEKLRKASIGVSYIPVNDRYNYQPPTKSYEYIAAGIPVIATKTFANADVINDKCGVLIGDTPQEFSEGLAYVYDKLSEYDSRVIQDQLGNLTWERISGDLIKYFYTLIEDRSRLRT